MHTRCPECHTMFNVTPDQLTVAGGRVRCGECMTVFDARVHTTLAAAAPPPPRDEENEHDVGALLRSWRTEGGGNGLPEWRTDARGAAIADRDESAIEALLHRQTEPAAPPPQRRESPREEPPPEPSGFHATPRTRHRLDFGSPEDDLPAALSRQRLDANQSVLTTTGLGVGSVLMVLLLGLQYAYFHRFELGQHPLLRPPFEKLCEVLHCTLPLPRKPSAITLLRKEVRSHGTRPNALVITGDMENGAGFAQAYPDVEISFQDLHGTVVASRRFKPAEYLLTGDDGSFPAGGKVGLRLEVADPGKEATGFEFKFY